MCKVLTFTNSSKLDVIKTTNEAAKLLMQTEKDGFGYAVKGKNGVYGEKCIAPEFYSRIKDKKPNPADIIEKTYSKFGNYSDPAGPMILHGRTSTNDSGLKNCHPMIKKDHYLIHNGVVDDYGPKYDKQTTNDSEDLLHRFINGIKQIEQYLQGYYAFACIDPTGKLHIVRDDTAKLYIAWSDKYSTYVIGTTRELLIGIGRKLDMKLGAIDPIKNDIHITFEGNKIISKEKIEPLGWTYGQASYASKSLGYDLNSNGAYKVDGSTGNVTKMSDYKTKSDSDDVEYWTDTTFRLEIEKVDDTWEIWDNRNEEINATEFHRLPFEFKKDCYLVSPDGYEVDFYSYKWASGGDYNRR